MSDVDAVVIGAGIVGLAIAAELAARGRDVLVLERADAIGTETSSRNSEVIHAGIYYPTHSLKADLCVRGKALLYEFCSSHQVAHRRIGKVIVASSAAEQPVLEDYVRQALTNGAGELTWLSRQQLYTLEPNVHGTAALWSESTGIIDSHGYMLALQQRLESHGGMIALHANLIDGEVTQRGFSLCVATGANEPNTRIESRVLVNCAGLEAPQVARRIAGVPTEGMPQAFYARGHYYAYSGRSPFAHLVYPIAEAGGLGVHVTLDMAGQARFGPDVLWLDELDYSFDDSSRERFGEAIRKYFPDLRAERLHPGYTGIRPKISGPKEPAADFYIATPRQHGIAGFANLLGIESPGLTASLAIAERVVPELIESVS